MTEAIKITQIDGIVKFGGYDWLVLEASEEKVLLLSDKTLENRAYHRTGVNCVTWAECDLRAYLNGEFYDSLGKDKTHIAETKISTNNSPLYGTDGGKDTIDKVFLLSMEEAVEYFATCDDSQPESQSNGVCSINNERDPSRIATDESGKASWWWLRSPGYDSFRAAYIYIDGSVNVLGSNVYDDSGGVRPALWLNLKSNYPMTRTERIEHLLACLIEECSEIQQAATKALRFGVDDKFEDYPTPRQQLNAEANDLLAVIEMLSDEGILTEAGNAHSIKAKKEKVLKYMQYAEKHKKKG